MKVSEINSILVIAEDILCSDGALPKVRDRIDLFRKWIEGNGWFGCYTSDPIDSIISKILIDNKVPYSETCTTKIFYAADGKDTKMIDKLIL